MRVNALTLEDVTGAPFLHNRETVAVVSICQKLSENDLMFF